MDKAPVNLSLLPGSFSLSPCPLPLGSSTDTETLGRFHRAIGDVPPRRCQIAVVERCATFSSATSPNLACRGARNSQKSKDYRVVVVGSRRRSPPCRASPSLSEHTFEFAVRLRFVLNLLPSSPRSRTSTRSSSLNGTAPPSAIAAVAHAPVTKEWQRRRFRVTCEVPRRLQLG